jgi:uncharacterized membrane protein
VTDGIFYVLVFLAILGTACMAGMFFAFSVFVMKGLDRLPAPTGIAAMQSINAAVGNPVFGLGFAGTALLCLVLAISSLVMIGEAGAPLVLAGSLVYLAGGLVLTVRYHIPRNNRLMKVDPASAASVEWWRRYVSEWTTWNHVRTVASLAAVGLFAIALT